MAQHYPSVSPVVKRVLRIGPEPVKAPSAIAVLHKAFDLLDTLQSGGGAKSLDELVRDTGIARSTAHRLLLNLIGRGYVERTSSGKFALGLKLLELGATVRQHQSLRDIARPIMLDLRNRLGETINLGKLRGISVLYLETIESEHAFRVSASLGILDPLHVTSIGKAILAWMPPERRPLLNDWRQLTPATVTDPSRFDEELALTRKRGYALDDEESMQGGRCIGVPILQNGYPVAGLSVSGPVARITRDRIKAIATDLRDAAALISDQMRLHPETE
jgi:IclR family acetate operon transcriptional repressor